MKATFPLLCAVLAPQLFTLNLNARGPEASPRLHTEGFVNGGAFEVRAEWDGQAGIMVESSFDLLTWTAEDLLPPPPAGGAVLFRDTKETQPQKFYRAQIYVFRMEGTVQDIETGAPISGAVVRLSFHSPVAELAGVTQTEAIGDFQLVGLPKTPSGNIELLVEKAGYEPLTIFRSYSPYLDQQPLHLELAPPGYRPPNDDFENRAVLVGTNITVEANTFASTSEPGHSLSIAYDDVVEDYPSNRWWIWTATFDGAVGVNLSPEHVRAGAVVYTGAALDDLTRVWDSAAGDVGFFVTTGTDYQIAVGTAAPDEAGFTLRAITPVPPVITEQPYPGDPLTGRTSNLVEAGGPILLWSESNGTQPLSYQWLKDGVEVSHATNRVLALEQAVLEDSGSYSVRVSNRAGSVVSEEVEITVMEESTHVP